MVKYLRLPVFIVILFLVSCTATPAAPTAEPGLTSINVEVVVEQLDIPWEMAFAPDGRIFLTERPGNIRIVKDGQLQARPWMKLDVAAVGEGGLLGLALDPNFAQNHLVYVYHTYRTADGQLQNRVCALDR